jgi:hypothetical protein
MSNNTVEQAAKEYADKRRPVHEYGRYESDYDYRTDERNNKDLQSHFIAGAAWQSSLPHEVEQRAIIESVGEYASGCVIESLQEGAKSAEVEDFQRQVEGYKDHSPAPPDSHK